MEIKNTNYRVWDDGAGTVTFEGQFRLGIEAENAIIDFLKKVVAGNPSTITVDISPSDFLGEEAINAICSLPRELRAYPAIKLVGRARKAGIGQPQVMSVFAALRSPFEAIWV